VRPQVIHAEDLQAGSSYDIPALTQQTFGSLRAADEIIDEGHFIGKALGEGLNGYRPIVELMNSNFGIYGMAELSSAGNTFATTGGAFKMPMTIIGAGGTAPNQSLGAEHSQPFHAYVMGIPGLKICTAASPAAAYGLTKAMIRDDGPGILFCPVKMMKEAKGKVDVGRCLPLNKAELLHKASEASVAAGKAVTVLTYLHGVKEAQARAPTRPRRPPARWAPHASPLSPRALCSPCRVHTPGRTRAHAHARSHASARTPSVSLAGCLAVSLPCSRALPLSRAPRSR
jgi:pyruvate/2-oxoglutarate/acetoin dehydrogenase E1 component